ncbi:hypothetical protein O3G_MSEX012047 [Manduca sexta]|uniref:Uncharacterized protein n=1 Tax=Manduca sexta TaxID=7130 RepID=A0A921ZNM4_MANSE|nr:hypothetical protein O3G_MSEX012047 [Manduca sexta]
MAVGVDTSKWKPRRVKGTPAAGFRNALSIGVITAGIITGLIFHFGSFTTNFRKAWDVLYEDPIEEVERRMLIASTLSSKTGDQIREALEEAKRIDRPEA